MNNAQIRLVSIGLESYAGISKSTKAEVILPENIDVSEHLKKLNPEEGIFILFPDEAHVLVAEGDQGKGKTSLINYLGEITGNFEAPANAVNRTDGSKKGRMRFYGQDGNLYEVRMTRATYVLEEIMTDDQGNPVLDAKGHDQRKECKSPKQTILKLLGPAGFDPLTLKKKNPAQQIEWLRTVAQLDTEAQKLELENKKRRQEYFTIRTNVNREILSLKNRIASSLFENDRPAWEARFAEDPYANLDAEIEAVRKDYEQYTVVEKAKETVLHNLVHAIQYVDILEKEIADMETKLAEKRALLEKTKLASDKDEARLKQAEEYLKNNKEIREKYEGLTEKVKEANRFENDKTSFQAYLADLDLLREKKNEALNLTEIIETCDRNKQAFLRQLTPQIEGIEVFVADETETREGIYYNGHPASEWAESESWEVCSQLWRNMGVRMVFVENVSSLGSGAIEKLNEFVQAGGYILGTQMNRKENNLKITIQNKLPQ